MKSEAMLLREMNDKLSGLGELNNITLAFQKQMKRIREIVTNTLDLDTLKVDVDQIQQDVETVKTNVLTIAGNAIDTSDIETKLDTLSSDLADVIAAIEANEVDVTANGVLLSTLDTSIQAVETDVESVVSAITTLNGKIDTVNTNLGTLESSLTAIESAIPSLSTMEASLAAIESAVEPVKTYIFTHSDFSGNVTFGTTNADDYRLSFDKEVEIIMLALDTGSTGWYFRYEGAADIFAGQICHCAATDKPGFVCSSYFPEQTAVYDFESSTLPVVLPVDQNIVINADINKIIDAVTLIVKCKGDAPTITFNSY
jgi:predicted  nucleic acid-binding Zn-ribbon protein